MAEPTADDVAEKETKPELDPEAQALREKTLAAARRMAEEAQVSSGTKPKTDDTETSKKQQEEASSAAEAESKQKDELQARLQRRLVLLRS